MTDSMTKLDAEKYMKKVPEWELEDDNLFRVVEFEEFSAGIDFVNEVAEISEDQEHHPDIDIRYTKITLRLHTHEVGGLTKKDFELAAKIDHLID